MTIQRNREILYNNLISQGYFVDEDGNLELTLDDFCENVEDEETALTFYENLVDAVVLVDETGKPLMTEDEFMLQIHGSYKKRTTYPLTENQRGVYIDWDLNRDALQYNVPNTFHFTGVDGRKVVEAVEKVIAAHPYLNTHLGTEGDDVVQIRQDEMRSQVEFHELSQPLTKEFLQSRIRPFDLFNDCLWRAEIYTCGGDTWLFTDMHHIVFDGLSNGIFMKEFLDAYKGQDIKKETYSALDRSLDEERLMKSERYGEAEKYYDELVRKTTSVEYPHSVVPDGDGGSKTYANPALVPKDKVDALCSRLQITPNSFFITILTQLLHRITREDNLMVTTVNNGRDDARMADIMGMFVKTLPVVSAMDKGSAEKTFGEIAKGMHQELMDSISNDFYPFTHIVERHHLHPQVMFVYEGGLFDNVDASDIKMDNIQLELNTSKVPLMIFAYPDTLGQNYTLLLEYDSLMYGKEDMQRLSDSFMTLIENVCVFPEKAIGHLPIVGEKEKNVLFDLGTGKKVDYPHKAFPTLFVEQAHRTPDAVAVVDKDSEMTYRELNRMSDILAHKLIELGVKPGGFVSVMLERKKEFVVAITAVHKTGCAYIPLDLDYPEERLQYMIENSETKVIVTEHGVRSIESNATRLYIDDIDYDIDVEPIDYSNFNNGLAYMIYTSGSTGKPKGVMMTQKGLTNVSYSFIDIENLTSADRLFVYASFSFDVHTADIFPILMLGGTTCIIPSEIRKDPDAVYQFLIDKKITGGCFPTAMGQLMVNTYGDLPLRYVMMAGEKMEGMVSTENLRIFNGYGPSEVTFCNMFELKTGVRYKNIPIGPPVINNYGFIVDTNNQLLPRGIAGEFVFAGCQVGAGYWKLPERTKEGFADCPFVAIDNEGHKVRMYHTGDLARWTEDGELECLGRIDNQVKLRGFRIEYGEIESIAQKVEGIRQAVACVKKIGDSDHLVLYYTLAEKAELTADELSRAISASSLTSYMVPDLYMKIDEIPLSPNGKVNRKALPNPSIQVDEIILPETERERQLFTIISDMIGNNQFGVTTNLVAIGMTSLMAMRMAIRINQEMGFGVQTKQILTNPTIRGIIESTEHTANVQQIITYERHDFYPITENQRGVYLDWEQHRDSTQYNQPYAFHFKDIDASKLAKAAEQVIAAHPYLNTRLSTEGDDIVQLRSDEMRSKVEMHQVENPVTKEFLQSRVRPFDLFNDCLWRIEIYTMGTETWMLMDVHHLIFDGLSSGIFLKELMEVYGGKDIVGETYSAFERALDEEQFLLSNRYVEVGSYFDHLLTDAVSIEYPHSVQPEDHKGLIDVVTKINHMSEVDALCAHLQITPNSFFLSALMEVFQRISRENHPMITTVSNGRDDLRMADAMGMFVKTVPVTIDSEQRQNQTFAQAAQSMHRQLLETLSRDIYPFTHLVQRHQLIPKIQYVYQGGLFDGVDSEAVQMEPIALSLDTVKFPLTVYVSPSINGEYYSMSLVADSSLYNRIDMERLSASIVALVYAAVIQPETKVANLPLVSKEATDELISLGSGTHLDLDVTKTFVQMFMEQAQKTPNAPAVVDRDSLYTYKEMDELSNALTRKLISEGVQPNEFVCVMLDRFKEFPMSVLAIHKAGAAYTPLDFEYPNERLMYMLENSESKVLITTHTVLKAKKEEGEFETGGANVIFLDDFDSLNDLNKSPINLTTPENLAYMIYTSGSTGKPKGAMLHQAGLSNFIAVVKDMEKLTPADRISGHRSFSFDAHIEDMYPVLTLGGSFHIMPSEIRKDLYAMRSFILEHQITGGGYSTAITCLLLNTFDDLPIRFITGGGEKMDGVFSDHIEIINVYGPTECTDDTSFYSIRPGKRVVNIPIGKSVPNNWNFIVDPTGSLVPRGMAGELCFAGIQVGRGYWHLPEKTAEVFGDCPFVKEDVWGRKVRMYHTGDLCRWNEDGDLEFLGRIDFQVKLRGYRIELGEIESKTLQIEGIKQAAAEVKKSNVMDYIVLYYTLQEGYQFGEDKIRNSLVASSLAEYMVPTVYMQLDSMPMTPNGKVNRKALPEPTVIDSVENVPPSNGKEAILLKIAQELLRHDGFGVTDNLIFQGFNSLMGIKFVAQAAQRQIKLKLDDLMKTKTIRGVLEHNTSMAFWYNEPDPKRPVVVVTCGETPYQNMLPYIEALSVNYSVFVIESIIEHYEYVFQDADVIEVTEMYYALIDLYIGSESDILCFTGHCFGGELSYRLANRWQKDHPGSHPTVVMLDVFWRVSNEMEAEEEAQIRALLPQEFLDKHQAEINHYISVSKMYETLNTGDSPVIYDGKFVLFRAMLSEPQEAHFTELPAELSAEISKHINVSRKTDNERFWKNIYPDMECYHVQGHHMSMLEANHVGEYVEWIDKQIVNKEKNLK